MEERQVYPNDLLEEFSKKLGKHLGSDDRVLLLRAQHLPFIEENEFDGLMIVLEAVECYEDSFTSEHKQMVRIVMERLRKIRETGGSEISLKSADKEEESMASFTQSIKYFFVDSEVTAEEPSARQGTKDAPAIVDCGADPSDESLSDKDGVHVPQLPSTSISPFDEDDERNLDSASPNVLPMDDSVPAEISLEFSAQRCIRDGIVEVQILQLPSLPDSPHYAGNLDTSPLNDLSIDEVEDTVHPLLAKAKTSDEVASSFNDAHEHTGHVECSEITSASALRHKKNIQINSSAIVIDMDDACLQESIAIRLTMPSTDAPSVAVQCSFSTVLSDRSNEHPDALLQQPVPFDSSLPSNTPDEQMVMIQNQPSEESPFTSDETPMDVVVLMERQGPKRAKKRTAAATQETPRSDRPRRAKRDVKTAEEISTQSTTEKNMHTYLNNPSLFNEEYKRDPVVKKLMRLLKSTSTQAANARLNSNGKMFQLWNDECSAANRHQLWKEREEEMMMKKEENGERTDKWKVAAIITCEKWELLQLPLYALIGRQLVLWDEFPLAAWSDKVDSWIEARVLFERRMAELDLIEHRLRRIHGDEEFDRIYSKRYLKEEKEGYLETHDAWYKAALHAIEDEYNRKNLDKPEIIIEDWLDTTGRGLEDLLNTEFINELIYDGFVKKLLGDENEDDTIFCRNCEGCTKKNDELGDTGFCCNDYFAKNTKGTDISYSCSSKCESDSRLNCPVRNGRTVRLCIFRDHVKGWSVRTLTSIAEKDFIFQTLGELQRQPTKRQPTNNGTDPANYDFEMGDCLPGRDEPITIAMARKSNEAKWVNHSCLGNSEPVAVVVERYRHVAFTRICFYASRDILAGEEITYNYFHQYKTKEDKRSNRLFAKCLCGTDVCYERD